MMSATVSIPESVLKNHEDRGRFACTKCSSLLQDPVQISCGHRLCKSCVDELIVNESVPQCPECKDEIVEEEGVKYFPDRFVKKEIFCLLVICLFSEFGCKWEGKYEQLHHHIEICEFAFSTCQFCGMKIRRGQIEAHSHSCKCVPRPCPLASLGCSKEILTNSKLQQHLEESTTEHMRMFASHLLSLEERLQKLKPFESNKQEVTTEFRGVCFRGWNPDFVKADVAGSSGRYDSGLGQSLPMQSKTQLVAHLQDTASESAGAMDWKVDEMLRANLESMKKELTRNFMGQLKAKDEEISGLKTTITKLEKTIRSKNAENEDRDFRLSLIENSNHNGSMIWKIPQFSQRKADAQNGKYTSIFSLPFYSGRYGYKMCLRLYIMGDGIGKGTHLSLFFVVMRGEFDNILQWPFTHKVSFKLINQAGGRDIVDSFQPDPMSSSFRKPRSDMNIASGSPRFVSHTELERGGFIVDDTIFVKCTVDTSSIRHP